MADSLKTEPGWKPPRNDKKLSALVVAGISTGVGIGAALAAALGLSSAQAREASTPVRTTGIVQTLPAGSISLDDRLKAIEESQRSLEHSFTAAMKGFELEIQELRDRLPPRKP